MSTEIEQDAAVARRLRLIGVLLLVAGALAAAAIYARATRDDQSGAIGYVVEGGQPYTVMPDDSKRYDYEMERSGGKGGALAFQLVEWFGSLWRGRRLASTLLCLSVAGSLACFLVAHVLSYSGPPDDPIAGGRS